jgi:hypothetical protein
MLLLLLPPLGWVARQVRPRRRASAGTPPQTSASLSSAERALDRALASLVPSAATRAGGGLAPALRAAGVAEPLVARSVAVRDRLLAHRYGPGSGGAGSASLADEAMAVAAELGSSHRSRRARRSAPIATIGVVVFAVAAASTSIAAMQNGRPDPMSLYAQGSVRAAAEGFAQQAAADRDDPAHWYNLGAAWYRLGDDARASAAWINAVRLAPRDATIRRALRLVPAPDPDTARRTRALPLTPAELALIAGLCWLAGWAVLLLRPAAARGGGALLATAVVVGAGALLIARDQSRPLAIVLQSTELRRSPHHRAPSIAPVEAGSAVRPLRHAAGWTLAEASDARRGWLPLDALSVINP